MNRGGAFGLLAVTVLMGCGGEAEIAAAHLVRDSAGVRIVENHRPLHSPGAWRAHGREVVCSPSGPSGDLDLVGITDVVPLSGGESAVLAGGTQMLLICRDGGVERKLGGRGEGPGEFNSLVGAARGLEDTVQVVGSSRITWMDTGDGGARTRSAGSISEGRGTRFISLGGHTALFTRSDRGPELIFLGRDGEATVTLPADDWPIVVARHTVTMVLWRIRLPGTLGKDGFWTASVDTVELRHTGLQGVDRIVRAPGAALNATEEYWEVGQEIAMTLFGGQIPEQAVESMVAWPDEEEKRIVPAVLEMLEGPGEEIWIRLARPNPIEGGDLWRVFDSDGVWLTDLTLPVRFHLVRIEGDEMYGVERDDLDLETIVRYTLDRDRGPA